MWHSILSCLSVVHILHRPSLVFRPARSGRPSPCAFLASGVTDLEALISALLSLDPLKIYSVSKPGSFPQNPKNQTGQVWMCRGSFLRGLSVLRLRSFQKWSLFKSLIAILVLPEGHRSLELFWNFFSCALSLGWGILVHSEREQSLV